MKKREMKPEKEKVQPRLSPEQEDYIDQLIVNGNFGDKRTTVALYLIQLGIRELTKEGYITPKRREKKD